MIVVGPDLHQVRRERRSDAITAMYMMIHMAKSPARDLRSRFHDGTLSA